MNEKLKKIDKIFSDGPIIPVVVIKELQQALPLAKAILAGGVRVIEVTLRTDDALSAIQLIREELPDMTVGAGTVKTVQQLKQCLKVKAQFAFSPGATQSLLEEGASSDIPFIPGVCSASELMEGLDEGFRYFKFFPAEVCGGVEALKALYGPFPEACFCPTGGIHKNNFLDYLALDNVACVGGSWVLPTELIEQENWNMISDLANRSVTLARETLF